jgi:hypothetical protein
VEGWEAIKMKRDKGENNISIRVKAIIIRIKITVEQEKEHICMEENPTMFHS